eukprot:g70471.t1
MKNRRFSSHEISGSNVARALYPTVPIGNDDGFVKILKGYRNPSRSKWFFFTANIDINPWSNRRLRSLSVRRPFHKKRDYTGKKNTVYTVELLRNFSPPLTYRTNPSAPLSGTVESTVRVFKQIFLIYNTRRAPHATIGKKYESSEYHSTNINLEKQYSLKKNSQMIYQLSRCCAPFRGEAIWIVPSSSRTPILSGSSSRTTQRPPGYVAHNISRDPGLVDCTVDLCGHIGLHSPSPSSQCG